MAKKSKREKRVVSARRRVEEHGSGVFERTTIRIPDGVSMFSIKQPGIRRVEIIPYEVGKGNPWADEGDLHYERTFWTHRNIGPNNDSYICLAKTFDKKCPICEERARMARDPDSDPDLLKALKPSERQLWNVLDLAEKEKGVQLWDVSYHLFGKQLEAAVAMGDDGEYDLFADLEQGKTVKMNVVKGSMGAGNYGEVSAVEFKDRKTPLDESILEQTHCLDDLLKETPYDKLKAIFLQVEEGSDEDEDEDDDEEETPKKKSKSASKKKPAEDDDEDENDDGDEELDEEDDEDSDDNEDDEEEEKPAAKKGKGKKIVNQAELAGMKVGMMVEHDDFGECKIVHISGDGTSLKLKDEDGEVHNGCDPDDCEIVEKEAKPKGKGKLADKKTAKGGKKKPADDDDDDDEDEDEEDDDDDD